MDISGVNSFDNHDAREWTAAYRDVGLAVAKSTIEVALGDKQNGGGLSIDLACRAVAAVEAVAFALGRGSEDGNQLFAGAPAAEAGMAESLIEDCNAMLDAIEEGSGLEVYWSETKPAQFEAWTAAVGDLRGRINGGAPVVAEPELAASEPLAKAQPVASAPEGVQAQLDEMRMALHELTDEVQQMRDEMNRKMLRLAELIKGQAE